jgi:DNA/RNA-binding domain of Phe-tRNA-synthetase-like protein
VSCEVAPHPLLEIAFVALDWPLAVGEIAVPDWPIEVPPLEPGASEAVRALLRHGGFKPAGRSKPCNEYIRRVAEEGTFPRINAVVDLTNLAVLRGGLPISTVDPDRLTPPFSVAIAAPGAKYVFNLGGQEIDLGGLLCLHDAEGPCANAVKDAQRAKTTPDTRRTLTVVWGTTALPGRAAQVAAWFGEHARALSAR